MITDIGYDILPVFLYSNLAGELFNLIINEEVFGKYIRMLEETFRLFIIKIPIGMIKKYTFEALNLTEGVCTIQLITRGGKIYKKYVKVE